MFHLADVQTTCMSLYNFCLSITAVQSLYLWSYSYCFFGLFSLHHWFTIDSIPETKIVEQTIYLYLYVCMYVKLVNSDAKHSKM